MGENDIRRVVESVEAVWLRRIFRTAIFSQATLLAIVAGGAIWATRIDSRVEKLEESVRKLTTAIDLVLSNSNRINLLDERILQVREEIKEQRAEDRRMAEEINKLKGAR